MSGVSRANKNHVTWYVFQVLKNTYEKLAIVYGTTEISRSVEVRRLVRGESRVVL